MSVLIAIACKANIAWLPGVSRSIAHFNARLMSGGKFVDVSLIRINMLSLNCDIVAKFLLETFRFIPEMGLRLGMVFLPVFFNTLFFFIDVYSIIVLKS
jgi:hypothetical protein